MKKYQTLSICVVAALLTACGGGSGGRTMAPNGNNQGGSTPSNTLPQHYGIPSHLQKAVSEAQQKQIKRAAVPGYDALTIGNNVYNQGDYVKTSDFDLGYSEQDYTESEEEYVTRKGQVKIYRMPYATIFNFITEPDITHNKYPGTSVPKFDGGLMGYYTDNNVPTAGKAVYQGVAFVGNEKGQFYLDVDFGRKVTAGKITNLSQNDIILGKGQVKPVASERSSDGPNKMGFIGDVQLNGNYTHLSQRYDIALDDSVSLNAGTDYQHHIYKGHFFGAEAEEVAGFIYGVDNKNDILDNELAVFAGQRGKIKK